MSDHPHGDAIQLLYAADEDHPSAALVLDDRGPTLRVETGRTEDAVRSQLRLIATHVRWLADRTDVPVEQVATDVATLAESADQFEER